MQYNIKYDMLNIPWYGFNLLCWNEEDVLT